MKNTAKAAPDEPAKGEAVRVGDVAHWLRERIRAGRIVPGQRLVEADIVRATGASRGRVREALQRLEGEGLILLEEFRGASVRQITKDEMRQIYRARMALEGMAAHDFAASLDAEAKRQLALLQEELNGFESTGDHERFARINDAWHLAIIEGAHNDYIRIFVERLRVPLYRLLFTTFYKAHRIDDANADHRQITAAILAGDAPEAERLMRNHIDHALSAVGQLEDDLAF